MFTLAFVALGFAQEAGAAEEWTALFDGKSLDGWVVRSGFAKYHVEDGAVVGTTVEKSPNTFLCTEKEYGDFILEFEVKVDPGLNSGVQIRSHASEKETVTYVERNDKKIKRVRPAGRVFGYQVEISNEASGSSGGIYDEARRGWLANVSDDPAASKAFKDNQWNKYRIECRGDSIKTFVNGVPCADLKDSVDARGLIGLQVHGVKGDPQYQVRWRNLRIQVLDKAAKGR
jgi:hypothetical protein